MSVIHVNDMTLLLSSESANLFNPRCAFGQSNWALRDEKGRLALPRDAEGNIVVVPGTKYQLVKVQEAKQRHEPAKVELPKPEPSKPKRHREEPVEYDEEDQPISQAPPPPKKEGKQNGEKIKALPPAAVPQAAKTSTTVAKPIDSTPTDKHHRSGAVAVSATKTAKEHPTPQQPPAPPKQRAPPPPQVADDDSDESPVQQPVRPSPRQVETKKKAIQPPRNDSDSD